MESQPQTPEIRDILKTFTHVSFPIEQRGSLNVCGVVEPNTNVNRSIKYSTRCYHGVVDIRVAL